MLGEPIAKLKGKIIGQRVLEVEGPTVETNLSFAGNIRGIPATEIETIVGRTVSTVVIHCEGQGVLLVDYDMATYTGEAIGKVNPSGIKVLGAIFFRDVLRVAN